LIGLLHLMGEPVLDKAREPRLIHAGNRSKS
jgi:hypothetical protein